jgi:hypothetical protein
MENEQNIPKIIDEKNITEEDLYFLSHIEGMKSTAGIFKEKYNKYMYGILKKYNINSIDFLKISKYVKNEKFYLVPALIEKYGPYQLDNSKTSYDFAGIKSFVIVLIGLVGIFFLVRTFIGGGKPSECDCRKVMMYEDGSVDAAKRILGGSYGAGFMERSQRECGLKYWDEIDKWQTSKGLSGTPKDNAMEYFMEKCK